MGESKVRASRSGMFLVVAFFGLFALVGAGVTMAMGIIPLWNAHEAEGWEVTTCTIQASHVGQHRSDDGTTYSVELEYTYDWLGQARTGDRYDFSIGSSSGRASKQAVVDAHPPGAQVPCFVNPHNPTRVVIQPNAGGFVWWGVFGLPFLAVGIVGPWLFLRSRARDEAAATAPPTDGPVELSPARGRWLSVVGFAVFAILWDSITLIGWTLADGDTFTQIFLSVFALLGAVLTFGVVPHRLLAAFNPRPRGVLADPLVIGGETDLMWTLDGRSESLTELVITLVGEEVATYRRGTKSVTQRWAFVERELARVGPTGDPSGGVVSIALPTGVPSFAARNNKVEWSLRFVGQIPRWPDLDETLALQVRSGPQRPAPILLNTPRPTVWEDGITVQLPQGSYAPGDMLDADVAWGDPGSKGEVLVTLLWYTVGKGTEDVVIVRQERFPTDGRAGRQRLAWPLPHEPWSFSGRLVGVTWALEASLEPRGEVHRLDFVLGPDRLEARL
ncbi:MAG: hypothetical protein ACI8PZ_006352 [Myxococcota bacterium]|jgi:hypothetical protein